nr:hypothetical protein [Tanacetum cinerariifolium]
CHRVYDRRQSSAFDSTLQVSQTFVILVVVEVRTERSLLPIINSELPLIQETKPLFKTTGLQCNKFRGDKGKIILISRIRAMLLVQKEIPQVDTQELLNATTAKVKDIWLGNALSLSDQEMQHGIRKKAMLAEAQEAGQILDEEQLAFLANPGIPAGQAQTILPHNAAFHTEDLDTYDSECDDLSTAQAVLMANISNYGSDVISEVPNSETYLNDMDNQSVHALQDFEQSPFMDFTDNEISIDSNIIPYSQYLQET